MDPVIVPYQATGKGVIYQPTLKTLRGEHSGSVDPSELSLEIPIHNGMAGRKRRAEVCFTFAIS